MIFLAATLLVLLAAVKLPSARDSYLFSFLLGVAVDLWVGTLVGITAGVFLVFTLAVWLFRRYFQFNLISFLLFAAVFLSLIYYGSHFFP